MGGAQTPFEREFAPKIPRKSHSGIHDKQAAPRGFVLHLSGQQVIDTRWFKMRLKTLNNNLSAACCACVIVNATVGLGQMALSAGIIH